jgi:bifunctional DNase/RNase
MALHAVLPIVLLAVLGCGARESRAPQDVLVHVSLVTLDAQNVPVVILEEESGERVLPIWIGPAEASSIAAEIHQQRPARPNSHDFAARLIEGLEGELLRVVVTEIRDGTYYAVLVLQAHGKRVEIDARPSDAIATALRAGAPILVREQVFQEAGETPVPDGSRRSVAWRAPARGGPATRVAEL